MNFIQHYLWQLVAATELLVIMVLLITLIRKRKKQTPEEARLRKAKKTEVNMGDLMNDLHLSKDLHKELSRVCHPDRFVGTELTELANVLFQLVQKNRSNYKELQLLKQRIELELLIKNN